MAGRRRGRHDPGGDAEPVSGGPGGGRGGSSGAADQAGPARWTRRGQRDGQAGAGRGRRCATLADMRGSALGGGGLMERSSGGEVKG